MTPTMHEQDYAEFSSRMFGRSAEAAQPTRCQFEITYRCNIHCLHCYTDPFNNSTHLRRELAVIEIERLLGEMADEGVMWLTLTGGEAFVHPQFKRLYLAAKRRGYVISLYSNGTCISDDLADFLAEHRPFTIDVSCHGATAQTFDAVAQVPGSFQRFIAGVTKLLARGLPVTVKTKAMTINREELPAIRALVKRFGLDFHLYTGIYPRLNGDLGPTAYRLSAQEIIQLEGGGPVQTVVCQPAESTAVPDPRLFRCGCGTNSFTISPYGVLRPCTFTTWPQYDLRQMPFLDAFRAMVMAIKDARYTTASPCVTCSAVQFCEKNPVMAEHEAGSMESPVPHFCNVAFARKHVEENSRTQPCG